MENLGFAEPGKGWELTMSGATSLDEGGDIPRNCSGGVLSSNAIGASGMIRFAEAARQALRVSRALPSRAALARLSRALLVGGRCEGEIEKG